MDQRFLKCIDPFLKVIYTKSHMKPMRLPTIVLTIWGNLNSRELRGERFERVVLLSTISLGVFTNQYLNTPIYIELFHTIFMQFNVPMPVLHSFYILSCFKT